MIEELGMAPDVQPITQVLVSLFEKEMITESLKIAKELRKEHIRTEMYLDHTKRIEKQLGYASRKGIPIVVLLGPDEISAGQVQIKNMIARKQYSLPRSEMLPFIKPRKPESQKAGKPAEIGRRF